MARRAEPELIYKPPPPLQESAARLVRSSAGEVAKRARVWGGTAGQPARIHLVELDRIGGEAGHGGSRVFVAAFETLKKRLSRPLVLKVCESNASHAADLERENEQFSAIEHLLPLMGGGIAQCVYAEKRRQVGVLWAAFFTEEVVSGLPDKAPEELRHLIEGEHWWKAEQTLKSAYRILAQAHRDSKLLRTGLIAHYEPYLRSEHGWETRFEDAFGTDPTIALWGRQFRNPLVVLRKLRENRRACEVTTRHGAVHGDLHPRNVLVGQGNVRACLIDWGWTQPTFHVIADFALMELSIKFFYLPWDLPRSALLKWEAALAQNWRGLPKPDDSRLAGAARLVRVIRTAARPYISGEPNMEAVTKQYLLPLFLMTMGTFAFAASVSNLDHLLLGAGILGEEVERQLGLSRRANA